MSSATGSCVAGAGCGAQRQSRSSLRAGIIGAVLAIVVVQFGSFAAAADAHGPVAPIATSYQARVSQLPAGVEAKVIDGDQRLWLRVPASDSLIVVDYRGAPYLRFGRAGVAVNQNSAMYYFNQNPAEVPPPNVGPRTAPHWSPVSSGHSYSWHDGRLHALATVAAPPGARYIGRWAVPVRVNGQATAIAGGLWHAPDPSLVWFWPIIVLALCVLAARRVERRVLAGQVMTGLAVLALAGTVIAGVGRELHGRPTVSVFQMVTLALIAAFVAWAALRLARRRAGYMTYFAVSCLAIWEGANLIPTLLNGFVLAAVPAFAARVACVVCMGCGIGLLLIPPRLIDEDLPADDGSAGQQDEDAVLWEHSV
jgi:hypothetical protein